MKYKLFALSLLGTVLLVSSAFAHEKFDVDQKIKDWKTELNLTDDQAKAIKPILEDYKNKMEDAHKDKEQRLSAVLSSDQMNKIKAMMHDKKND